MDVQQRFGKRSKHHQANKTLRTAEKRAEEDRANVDLAVLPIGEVIQVHSLYIEVEHAGEVFLCVARKTLYKVQGATSIVVGDKVRYRAGESSAEPGQPKAVIEEVMLPRETLLTRADSFKQISTHPIVANAQQMLIVSSVVEPRVKWGLIDRMIVAAQGGKLAPIVCLNKLDLAQDFPEDLATARAALAHYGSMGIATIIASATTGEGLDDLRKMLAGKTTVLAGHSGVGKSSLIGAIQPGLDIRIGDISGFNQKGRHTTTSARRYVLDFAGPDVRTTVVDTPGVKLFGLWGVTHENLGEFFPDVEDGTAPPWRRDSYERILASIGAKDGRVEREER